MKDSRRLAALGVAIAIAGVPATAAADEAGLAPVAPASAAGPKSIVWVDPAEGHSQRTSTGAMLTGIGLSIVGAIQVPIGVALLASSNSFGCAEPPIRGGGGGTFSCTNPEDSKHRAGAILIGVGATALLSGVGLTIWGASPKSQGTDVRLGLGSVAATYRF